MCLSIPAMIVTIEGDYGTVTSGSNYFKVGLHLLDDPKPGQFVLVHAGFAIQTIDQSEAEETLDLIRQMQQLEKGGDIESGES